jgi:TPR repeat protein
MSDKGLDKAELTKWWDVLDVLDVLEHHGCDVEKALRIARESRHPDAVWLASLFSPGVAVTRARMVEVMREQGEDARALHVAWMLGHDEEHDLLERAAAKGYAPAQADLSSVRGGSRGFELAQLAAAQGSRRGMYHLGWRLRFGRGCAKDENRATELFRAAAELGEASAEVSYGEVAFGERDWERFHWWSRAVARGRAKRGFWRGTVSLLSAFEKGELGRVLHIAAPLLRANLNVVKQEVFGSYVGEEVSQKLLRVLELHEAMLDRARRAIACWSVVGRRRGVVKDMRVMIAKMLWEEPWQWGEKDGAAQGTKKARTN